MVDDQVVASQLEGLRRRLAEGRELVGLDQQTLALRSGVSRVMLSDFERGARTPSMEHFYRICSGGRLSPAWVATGNGTPILVSPTRDEIRDEAQHLRSLEVHFVEAINALFRKYRTDKQHRSWALSGCIQVYFGAHWLGFSDFSEVAQIVETVADRSGLNLIEVLEDTQHCNAAQYISDWLLHRGIDPEAFGTELQEDRMTYAVKYRASMARAPEELRKLAKKPTSHKEPKAGSRVSGALDYLLSFVRSTTSGGQPK